VRCHETPLVQGSCGSGFLGRNIMKSIITVLIILCFVQICASNPASENYILQQWSLSSGNNTSNPPSSSNYILKGSAIGVISGDEATSINYNNLPGYYLGAIEGGILPPANVIISVVNDSVLISWDAVAGASSYKVYSSDAPNSGFTEDTKGMNNKACLQAGFS